MVQTKSMITVNKKKIRGWKRRIKEIDRWFEAYKMPDLDRFKTKGEDYVKIRISPWNLVCERIPPNWYFRLIAQKLVLIHDIWKDIFESQQIPYDLQIWLNYPNTIRSRIVCAKVESFGEIRDNYYRESTKNNILPPMWASHVKELKNFTWQQHDDEDFAFKNLEYLDSQEIDELLKFGFNEDKIIIDGVEDTRYSRKVGNVWIGRKI
ncbi:hypothetical protein LZD49_13025 [Dyadobacter sp. CY261]|uniref:hypothetical protein n=1 Tax=Dyadobacter sp. CY261 TaxID=2907203 RepID=UPI001F25D372|nr:hypothetical protein [Dyadobacter sp. CY261]MCF0071398.1 hypothetical protein [Dyadobacter sp. CY261]